MRLDIKRALFIASLSLPILLGSDRLLAADDATQAPSKSVLVPVPTTKILAIGRLTAKGTQKAIGPILPSEMHDTAVAYLAGKIDQWYVMTDQTGVVFVMNVSTVSEARAVLDKFPLGRAKMMEFEFLPLGPLSPLRLLLGQ